MSTVPQETRRTDLASAKDVDITDSASRKRWCETLGVTDDALVAAVAAVGTSVDRIKDYLGAGGMAGRQQDA